MDIPGDNHIVDRSYDLDFLSSSDARLLRIMWEILEPRSKFRDLGIDRTVVFFGSARIKPKEELTDSATRSQLIMAKYYDEAVEVSRQLTEWSLELPNKDRFIICSGGGKGIMEAANRGAYEAGGKSIGLNIDLPAEEGANRYISPGLYLDFHYFFMRKLWFANLAEALLIFPGGFGTLDELMELLTLVQTEKMQKEIPIVIYGSEYWNEIINFDAMVKWGTISEADLQLFQFAETPIEAVELIKQNIRREEVA